MGDRIKYICDLRGFSLNRLGELSGLASGPVSRLSRRTEPIAGSPETLVKIADAAKVNLRWLVDGKGSVEAQQPRDAAARRALAAELAREEGVDEAAIQDVLAWVGNEERSTLWWATKMRLRELALTGYKQGVSVSLVGDEQWSEGTGYSPPRRPFEKP